MRHPRARWGALHTPAPLLSYTLKLHRRLRHAPARYSDLEDRGLILEKLLQWRHLVPTAPDTLAAYPFTQADPFILTDAPHVLFAGNQPAFATRLVEGPAGQRVRCVAVPRFASTGVVVLLNLATLACHPIKFDATMEA